MKVAVITPYHDKPTDWIYQCIDSVSSQSYKNILHVLIGDGFNNCDINASDKLYKISLSHNIGDYGDTPRSLGAIYALSQGADALVFLDCDNWLEPEHIESLVELQRKTGARVVSSYRKVASLEGEIMGVCPESDGIIFSDTNCMFFTREAADTAISWWSIPQELHAIDDRVIWDRVLTAGNSIACSEKSTAIYRTGFEGHYTFFEKDVPADAKSGDDIFEVYSRVDELVQRAQRLAPDLVRKEEVLSCGA